MWAGFASVVGDGGCCWGGGRGLGVAVVDVGGRRVGVVVVVFPEAVGVVELGRFVLGVDERVDAPGSVRVESLRTGETGCWLAARSLDLQAAKE